MPSSPHTIYRPRLDTTAERELDALAAVYRFLLDCHAKKSAVPSAPDDAEGEKHDRAATII
jgi:hypothetical protein